MSNRAGTDEAFIEMVLALGASGSQNNGMIGYLVGLAKDQFGAQWALTDKKESELKPVTKVKKTGSSAVYNVRPGYVLSEEILGVLSRAKESMNTSEITKAVHVKGVFYTGRTLVHLNRKAVYPALHRLVQNGEIKRVDVDGRTHFVIAK